MLNIVFLCPSLEPGRDGVGDYTRQLASELILQGHQVSLVALNDKALTDECMGVQTANGVSIPVLRIPATWSSKQRFERAKQWIDMIDPEWLSLQYVPFGFQKKGLTFGLGNRLKQLGCDRKWQIMFHELWVGIEKEATFKFKVWGYIQKYFISRMISKLIPICIHTHSQIYQSYLIKMGFPAKRLPLFSNIEQVQLVRRLNAQIKMIVFGVIHPLAPINQFVNELIQYRNTNNIDIKITFLGRSGNELENWVTVWSRAGFTVEIIGEQESTIISELLNHSTVGLSTTAFAVVEKSSAIATMQAHGLPVICISRPWTPRGVVPPVSFPGINEYNGSNLIECLNFSRNPPLMNSLPSVCRLFINTLISSTPLCKLNG